MIAPVTMQSFRPTVPQKRPAPRPLKGLWAICAGVAILGGLTLAAEQGHAQATRGNLAEGVAAIVNDQPITSFDLRQRTRFLLESAGVRDVTQDLVRQASEQALNSLINERLQIQEAAKFKQSMSDAEVDRVLARQAQQNGTTLEEFLSQLRQVGLSPASFREKTRAEVLWQRIVNGRFGSRVRVSRERVDEALSRIEASANKPQFLVSEILVEAETPEELAQATQGAATLVQQLRAGAPFQAVAQEYSFAPSAATGGDLGWITLGELRPEVATRLETMQAGQVSDPIPVTGGLMIVALRDRREARAPVAKLTLKEMTRAVEAGADDATWRLAEAAVNQARNALRDGCEGVDRAARRGGVEAIDLGEVQDGDLDEPFKSQATALGVGQSSGAFRSDRGVHALVLCGRQVSGDDLPNRDQLEDRLYEQELSLIARRYLRDLRREAAIVTR
jgi:peptidyl-prolyl cis-trans isomerase SurA